MSAYLSFFVRRENTFIPIGSYSRSTKIAQAFDTIAPWEMVRAISFEDIARVKEIIKDAEERIMAHISSMEARIEFLKSCDAEDIEERLAGFDLSKEDIEEAKTELSEVTAAKLFVGWIEAMMRDAQYMECKGLDYKNYVYAGWEIMDPKAEDII